MTPEELRFLARNLEEVASQLEDGRGVLYRDDQMEAEKARFGDFDIIVCGYLIKRTECAPHFFK